jgi:predicted amidohydrolase
MHKKESSSKFRPLQPVSVRSVNFFAKPGDPEANAASILRWIDLAARARKKGRPKWPDFILFPEMCVSGYVNDTSELRAMRMRVENAITAVLSASKNIPETVLLAGYPFYSGNAVYIRHSAIRKGEFLFHHDKTALSPRERRTFSPGSGVARFIAGAAGARCAILLCYENHFPELAAQLADEGCDIIFAPFASPMETPRQKYRRMLRFLPARAYDNGCFLVSCNVIQDFPRTGRSPGTALIIGPKGELIAKAVSRREGSCGAVLYLGEIERIKKSEMGYFRGNKP